MTISEKHVEAIREWAVDVLPVDWESGVQRREPGPQLPRRQPGKAPSIASRSIRHD